MIKFWIAILVALQAGAAPAQRSAPQIEELAIAELTKPFSSGGEGLIEAIGSRDGAIAYLYGSTKRLNLLADFAHAAQLEVGHDAFLQDAWASESLDRLSAANSGKEIEAKNFVDRIKDRQVEQMLAASLFGLKSFPEARRSPNYASLSAIARSVAGRAFLQSREAREYAVSCASKIKSDAERSYECEAFEARPEVKRLLETLDGRSFAEAYGLALGHGRVAWIVSNADGRAASRYVSADALKRTGLVSPDSAVTDPQP